MAFALTELTDSRLTPSILGHYLKINAPIAQLDRALPSEGRGLRFES